MTSNLRTEALASDFQESFNEDYNAPDKLCPIAVIGFSLKFPQEASSEKGFWEMLSSKRSAMTEIPENRFNIDSFYHPDGSRSDSVPIRGAHFLQEDLGLFDAPFFSITSAEAMSMDPQQRNALETTYRALENAGVTLAKASGSKTSVYTGSFSDDYKLMVCRDMEPTIPQHSATGLAITLLANRISWFYNLTGPSVNLDSACSSSMMALDFACQGLRSGDTMMSLVVGSNTIFALEPFLTLTNMGFLSPDSRSFSFDERANGYSRGEGFGVVVLKRLDDAVRDNDTIRAVIRSTGSNQDGRTPGITQPSKEAQERLINETYQKAGLDLKPTRFFEAHGTGTPVGDPIEANAIGAAFRKYRSAEDPLYIGAVKSNIGHLEGASGVAGLIKAIMVLERGIIPPNANFEVMNPNIDAEFLKIMFPLCNTPWPSSGLRRASVNSFGFGGANSHAVLDDAYNYLRLRDIKGNHSTTKSPPSFGALNPETSSTMRGASMTFELENLVGHPASLTNDNGTENINDYLKNFQYPRLLVWSAADEGGLARMRSLYHDYFMSLSRSMLEDFRYIDNLAYTLAVRRTLFSWKAFSLINSEHQLIQSDLAMSTPIRSSSKLGICYVFTGQGAQFSGMGKELMAFAEFRKVLLTADKYLREFGCVWSVTDELLKAKEVSRVNDAQYSQPLCTILQIAQVELLRSFNIVPLSVIGHSSGEIAAGYCMGALSLRAACKVAYFRGLLSSQLTEDCQTQGSMMAVGLSESETHAYLDRVLNQYGASALVVACINSPHNVTISGNPAHLDFFNNISPKMENSVENCKLM